MMKMKKFLPLIMLCFAASGWGQKPVMQLTFTAVNNTSFQQLDSISIINQTRGTDTVLYYPDTVLMLDYFTGIPHGRNPGSFRVFPNVPNPVTDQTSIMVYVPVRDNVTISVSDVMGKTMVRKEFLLDRGYHMFRLIPGEDELFFFTVWWKGEKSCLRILHTRKESRQPCLLDYAGMATPSVETRKSSTEQYFLFFPGDELIYTGYSGSMQSTIPDYPLSDTIYVFDFMMSQACPGISTVTYQGQTYNTVQIGDQCWLRENLNVGIRIPGSQAQTNNGQIEKYCFNNDISNCDIYGGLYQWDEVMQYFSFEGVRGLCPDGWHIPSDEDLCMLEQSVDPAISCGVTGWRGTDGGGALKERGTAHWNTPNTGATNSSGFSFFGSGSWNPAGSGFTDLLSSGYLWSSTLNGTTPWRRGLTYNGQQVERSSVNKNQGYSIRCVKGQGSANIQTFDFNPSDDVTILQNNPSQNAGGADTLYTRNSNGALGSNDWTRDILINFDISSLPAGAHVVSAELYLYYCNYRDNNPSGRSLSAYKITSSWSENSVTWNSQPGYAAQSTSSSGIPSSTGNWMSWDVSADVQSIINAQPVVNWGWKITDGVAWNWFNIPMAYFYSKEEGNFIPYLEITVTPN
jgi:uncharacterized protein (TIGR02145 family)